ncbi:MAG TPA: GNAT family N-acetyltransferase [Bryobacteraceae bacterium]|nr:GNAT family N-acetyltransferase [Bryobacteraceae bacterium]
MSNGVVFCRVQSWFTGRRLVSLPFSDHCEPLVGTSEDFATLLSSIQEKARLENCSYAEVRSTRAFSTITSHGWPEMRRYFLHRLDLRGGPAMVFSNFHSACVQRRIGRAEKSGISIREGRDPGILKDFYQLVIETRRRHGLLPPPKIWFANVAKYLGRSALIYCAYKDGRAVGAILALEFKNTLYYKNGASLPQFHKLGVMPYLLWHAIHTGIDRGLKVLDWGRSDCDNLGLVTFKERWNAERQPISYLRWPGGRPSADRTWIRRLLPATCKIAPANCLAALGAFSYRHFA